MQAGAPPGALTAITVHERRLETGCRTVLSEVSPRAQGLATDRTLRARTACNMLAPAFMVACRSAVLAAATASSSRWASACDHNPFESSCSARSPCRAAGHVAHVIASIVDCLCLITAVLLAPHSRSPPCHKGRPRSTSHPELQHAALSLRPQSQVTPAHNAFSWPLRLGDAPSAAGYCILVSSDRAVQPAPQHKSASSPFQGASCQVLLRAAGTRPTSRGLRAEAVPPHRPRVTPAS